MTVPEPFGARLRRAMDRRGPLCVGVDPHPELLAAWQLPDDVEGLARFADGVVAALADRVAVLKPQSAFFERHGSRGVAVLERVVADARSAGALVLLDVKRGDIGSTVAAYAGAYFGPAAPLRCDAVTLSPYLGYASLRPALDAARADRAGAFVLARTSNPEGAETQTATTASGLPLAQRVLHQLAEENAGAAPLGSFGAVVGATVGDTALDLSVNGPLLAPGLGAQGATAADLPRVFGDALGQVLPSVSRGLLRRGPGIGALREAAAREIEGLTDVLP
ncbi:orotidine-5'-phosphate decarboxylase [Streptomyces profundus]|uniref:orotidine-5'-phosphate decarboxylase n=1 Tax=Streptomyces profundus TaxID=2867410 RepID=UPI001D166285|nr:orotidine-5'-phosphate decarboxylase [Streptomyces sp. MA3_2.13]UED83013.1 orotidine-5'-phosphate decarboxylase [Streptomyces sp. MA3_2.13]